MKPTLLYCNTVYTADPPSDINPLILQRYKGQPLLVLCARELQVIRIAERIQTDPLYQDQLIIFYGWWDAPSMGLFDPETFFLKVDELMAYKVVVVLDKKRIDPSFLPYVTAVENKLKE